MIDAAPAVAGLLRRAVRAGIAPGATARWGRADGDLLSASAGFSAVPPTRVSVDDQTWFDLASLTKPLVTTTLALLAFRSRDLEPRTRVGQILTELNGSEVGEIEVESLLTHTSGLPAWLPLYSVAEGRPELLPARLERVTLDSRPGEHVVYSCVGFVILGLMLERVAGEGLDTLFRREVTAPLGLGAELGFKPESDTQSPIHGARVPVVEERLTRELGFDPKWIPPVGTDLPDDGNARFLGGTAGNAGLFGSARGVMTLASEYLPDRGSLISSEECAAATASRTQGLEQERSWGWQLASSPGSSAGPALSSKAFGHTGFTGVSVWCDPQTDDLFVLLTNRNYPAQRENDLHPLRRRFHALASGMIHGSVG